MKRVIKHLALLFLGVFGFSHMAHPQETDKLMKLRMAQGFEEAGEWERAASLYEDLYKTEPRNYIFTDGLQRSYTQIKEYGNAIGVIRNWLTYQPRDFNMMTTLGGLYYDSGNETTADSVWKSVIATDPNNVQLYRVIANEMMEHRLYENAIRIYLDGRKVGKKEILFADELGTIYSALQQYNSAAQEYTRLVKNSPEQLSLAQSRLSSFTQKPEALKSAADAVSAEIKILPDNPAIRRLYVWLLIEGHQYELALEQYRMIDRLSNANGNEFFNFAQRLNREHEYKTAAKTFNEIITKYNNPQILPQARFGYARAIEELSEQSDTAMTAPATTSTPATELQPTYRGAITLYESIAADYRTLDLSSQAIFRIGIIKFEKLFDLDGALDAFTRIKCLPQSVNLYSDIMLKIGEVQTARNNIIEARKEYDQLVKMPQIAYQDQAAFKIAELEYYGAGFDTALSILKRFNTKLNTDITNDALQLQYFIQENQSTSPKALTEFAKADLLLRQRKFSESLALFREITKSYPTALLVDDAMMKIGELNLLLKHPDEAIRSFQFVADSIQQSILKDRAQFRIAEIYQSILNNKMLAIESYEKLLTQFPNSLYAEESRKRIRTLRGDVF
jgi:cellulose synthase operon protein C